MRPCNTRQHVRFGDQTLISTLLCLSAHWHLKSIKMLNNTNGHIKGQTISNCFTKDEAKNHTDQEKMIFAFDWFALEVPEFVWSKVASLHISV